jgi:AraC-like DNA-binding protein
MAQIKPLPFYPIQPRHPSIRRLGLAAEYFPRYVHREEDLHTIDVVLLSVILRGRGRHLLDDEVRPITGCSVDVTHYGQRHDIVTDARGMDIYNVYLDLRNHTLPVLPENLRATLSAILPIHHRLAHQLNRRVTVRLDQADLLVASLRRIEEEMNSPEPGAREIVQHSFQVFLIDLCRAAQRHGLVLSPSQHGVFPAWVEKLREVMDRDFPQPHDLRTLARNAGVSVAYLCRIFKAYTGKTVIEYLIERRIQAAIWKLREGDEKIISIALACGFNDLAYFNRAFKRIVGATPSGYRRKIKKPQSKDRRKKTENSHQ